SGRRIREHCRGRIPVADFAYRRMSQQPAVLPAELQGIRAYWTRQWGEFDPHVEPLAIHRGRGGKVCVCVRQRVKGLGGEVLSDSELLHVFTVNAGLIAPWGSGRSLRRISTPI